MEVDRDREGREMGGVMGVLDWFMKRKNHWLARNYQKTSGNSRVRRRFRSRGQGKEPGAGGRRSQVKEAEDRQLLLARPPLRPVGGFLPRLPFSPLIVAPLLPTILGSSPTPFSSYAFLSSTSFSYISISSTSLSSTFTFVSSPSLTSTISSSSSFTFS